VQSLGITIGFSTTNKLISRFIRWITRSPVSHAWIAFDDHCLQTRLVMQAESWGYEVRPWKRWKRENTLVAEFEPTGPPLEENLVWIAQFLGAKYDYRSAIWSGLWRWFGRWVRGKFHTPGKLMCAEATIRFLLHRELYSSLAHFDPEVTNPKRLMDRVFELALGYSRDFKIKFARPDLEQRYRAKLLKG